MSNSFAMESVRRTMKTSAALLVILLTAGAALAQPAEEEKVTPPQRPDYSKPALEKVFLETEYRQRITYRPGAVDFNALGMSWTFRYLPTLMMPLSGSYPGVTQTLPNPFDLTRTVIATSPRAARRGREFNRELRKINKRLNAEVKVKAE